MPGDCSLTSDSLSFLRAKPFRYSEAALLRPIVFVILSSRATSPTQLTSLQPLASAVSEVRPFLRRWFSMFRPVLVALAFAVVLPGSSVAATKNIGPRGEELLFLENGTIKIGLDRAKGGAITWLSSATYSRNMVNIADPGRLIQQSYYAGLRLDRKAE